MLHTKHNNFNLCIVRTVFILNKNRVYSSVLSDTVLGFNSCLLRDGCDLVVLILCDRGIFTILKIAQIQCYIHETALQGFSSELPCNGNVIT